MLSISTKSPLYKHILRTLVILAFFTILYSAFAYRQELPDLPLPHDIARQLAGNTNIVGKGLVDDVFNSTLGFQKIFAISLPERTDHRDRILLQSAVSELEIDLIDGVHGETVPENVLPPGHGELTDNEIGCWRAHMSALERVVAKNMSSALIVEDDADWDIRIKPIMHTFAISAQALVADPVKDRELNFVDLPQPPRNPPKISPYGDDWDLLWLGHCGADLGHDLPKKRVIINNDESTPEPRYYSTWVPNEQSPLARYPKHTRAVVLNHYHTCTQAYAVSQRGARKLLHYVGLNVLHSAIDIIMREWCDDAGTGNCVSPVPPLFDQHRPAGPISDSSIRPGATGTRDHAFTPNIRTSVALNLEKLLNGSTDYIDQFPDKR